MKKFLFVLAIAAIFAGCQKDPSTVVKISTADLTSISYQLKGTWLYPSENERIIEPASGAIDSVFNGLGPALQFDGASGVNILQDTKTTLKGTYSLSTKNGLVYVDITYPNGSDVLYQILSNDGQTLKLESVIPYAPANSPTPDDVKQLTTDLTLEKQSGADVAGHLVRVIVKSSIAYYSVSVSVKEPAPADSTAVLSTKLNTVGTYTYEFSAKPNDQLYVDVLGDYTQTIFFAYHNGVPLAGNVGYDFQEIKTTTGWLIP